MKKQVMLAMGIVVLSVVSLTGCASAIELTDRESDLIAEYSASVLLNNSSNYPDRLVKATNAPQTTAEPGVSPTEPIVSSEPVATQAPVATPIPEKATPVPAQTISPSKAQVKLNDIFKISKVDFSYHSTRFSSKYSESGGLYSFRADPNKILMISKFTVKNNNSKKVSIDLMSRIRYYLDADGTKYEAEAVPTLANGGLNYLKTKIAAGKKDEAVLIFSVPTSVKQAKAIVIRVREGSKESLVKIK